MNRGVCLLKHETAHLQVVHNDHLPKRTITTGIGRGSAIAGAGASPTGRSAPLFRAGSADVITQDQMH